MIPLAYSTRNLRVRKATTVATALGIGLVVFVFSSVLMLGRGIRETLGRSGSPDVAIVLRDGSDSELVSGIEGPSAGLLMNASEVRRRPDGRPDAVSEAVVVVQLDKLGTQGVSNVLVRGVPDDVWAFRPGVTFTRGRRPRPGSDECAVGAAIAGRFRGLALDQSFEIKKNRRLQVVGVFSDHGSSFESEVWADGDGVRSAFGRGSSVSSVRVRLASPSAFESFRRGMEGNRQLSVDVKRETVYYEDQSQGTSAFIQAIGLVVAVFFSFGAMIGAMITMHASVAARQREVGTLRALGFSKKSILAAFLFESVVLASVGGLLGALGSLGMRFAHFSFVNFASWSEVVFEFTPTPGILVASLGFSMVMGLVGGLWPAVRAARLGVLEALRG